MRSLKNFAIASTLALGLVAPATANADQVDDLLNRIPAGQISCTQANSYWTNYSDYQSKRSQALAVAPFHPRGAEIRSAISRIDEAINRCGLRNTTGNSNANRPAPSQPAPGNNTATPTRPAPGGNTATRPAPAPAANTPAVLSSQTLPANIAAMKITVPGIGTVTVTQLIAVVNQLLAQWNIRL